MDKPSKTPWPGLPAKGEFDPGDWDESALLINELGSEDHLAARILDERNRREWSQEKLARQMARVGCKIGQSAIWKIENPVNGRRRAISVEEALAFSRAFQIPLVNLLLPQDVLERAWFYKDLREAPHRRDMINSQMSKYLTLLDNVEREARNDVERWRAEFKQRLANAKEALGQAEDKFVRGSLEGEIEFCIDMLDRLGKEGARDE